MIFWVGWYDPKSLFRCKTVLLCLFWPTCTILFLFHLLFLDCRSAFFKSLKMFPITQVNWLMSNSSMASEMFLRYVPSPSGKTAPTMTFSFVSFPSFCHEIFSAEGQKPLTWQITGENGVFWKKEMLPGGKKAEKQKWVSVYPLYLMYMSSVCVSSAHETLWPMLGLKSTLLVTSQKHRSIGLYDRRSIILTNSETAISPFYMDWWFITKNAEKNRVENTGAFVWCYWLSLRVLKCMYILLQCPVSVPVCSRFSFPNLFSQVTHSLLM